jgi:hypothetical protein
MLASPKRSELAAAQETPLTCIPLYSVTVLAAGSRPVVGAVLGFHVGVAAPDVPGLNATTDAVVTIVVSAPANKTTTESSVQSARRWRRRPCGCSLARFVDDWPFTPTARPLSIARLGPRGRRPASPSSVLMSEIAIRQTAYFAVPPAFEHRGRAPPSSVHLASVGGASISAPGYRARRR